MDETRYRIPPGAITRVLIIRGLLLLAIFAGVLALLVIFGGREGTGDRGRIAWVGTAAIAVFATGFGLARLRDDLRSLEIAVGGDGIRRATRREEEAIARDEVERIVALGNGSLTVVAREDRARIQVPPQLRDFEHLRTTLASWRPFERPGGKVQEIVLGVAWLGALIAHRWAVPRIEDAGTAIAVLVLIAGIYLAAAAWLRRHPSMDKKSAAIIAGAQLVFALGAAFDIIERAAGL